MQEEEVTEVTAPAGKDIISLNQITYHIFKSLRDSKKQVRLPVPGGQRNIFFGQNVSRIVTRQQETKRRASPSPAASVTFFQ